MEREEIKNLVIKSIQESNFEKLTENPEIVWFLSGELLKRTPLIIKLRNELAKSNEVFDFSNFVIANLILCIFTQATVSVHDIITKKLEDETLTQSSQKVEDVMKWVDMETNPHLYVKQRSIIDDLKEFNNMLIGKGNKTLNTFDELVDSFYKQYNELKVIIPLLHKNVVEESLRHITTTDPDLIKMGFGKREE